MSQDFRLLRPLLAALLVLALAGACSSSSEGSGTPGQDVTTADSGGVHFEPVDTQETSEDVITGDPDLVEPPVDTSDPTPDLGGGDPDVGVEPDCVTGDDCPDGYRCSGGECVPESGLDCPGDDCPTNPGAVMQVTPPDELTFSYMPGVALAVARNIIISSSGDGPVIVYGIELSETTSSDFTLFDLPSFPATLHPGDMLDFDVQFEEVSANPPAGQLRIYSNVVGQSLTTLRLVPQPKGATPQPCIIVNPTSLDFGTIERGQTATRQVEITSCSGQMIPLVVTEIERGSGFFGGLRDEFQIGRPENVPATLTAGAPTVTQTFTFTGGLAGTWSGYFNILSNDPEQPEVRLDVKGTSEPPPLESQGIHIQLDWDSDNCDVDLHLIAPGGSFYNAPKDCYYGNMSPDWGVSGNTLDDPFLDADNVWGYGPENINLQEPVPGTYRVVIHYYLDSYNGSNSTSTNATVNVFSYGNLLGTYGPTYLQGTDSMWDVVDITWTAGSGATVTPLGNVYTR